ncbi:urease accessory protein UreF [Roseibaca sp. Y0-43]|uniref:urease accessory protein UreF n=1 Tax=Roseibaca sp. Y0-43 TaxID=2816854 RepID=UPI001D0CAF1C|nr:urease accessory UreF family protein [Roseibaca sp. Y0-43]MCC1480942.1 urease accessory protein UreF [Roseibaca sp. Y0-43]
MTTTITTPDTQALLSLVQWLSPAFPTGAFAYSHGLEQAIALGEVANAEGFGAWLAAILEHGTGWNDAVVLACALRAGADFDALDQTARALAGSAERLRETVEQGAAFALARGQMGQADAVAEVLPVAVGRAAVTLGLPAQTVIAVYLHAFASNLTSAAVRFVPLGQAAGQKVLAAQHARITRLADRAAGATLDALASGAFRAELHAMAHETLDVRIFKT